MPKTILVIEDEEDVTDLIRYHLKKSGFRVLVASDGVSGLKTATSEHPDVIILDLMLPGLNGLEVAKRLRAQDRTRSTPLLILSAKGEPESRIKGLELGADDYLSKPFSPRELTLRIQGLIRRSAAPAVEEASVAGPFVLDRKALKVTLEGRRLDLTSTEFKLLSMLVEKAGAIHSREKLLEAVWGYKGTVDTRTVDTHMRRLREKLGDHSAWLETVRGVGYRFIPPAA